MRRRSCAVSCSRPSRAGANDGAAEPRRRLGGYGSRRAEWGRRGVYGLRRAQRPAQRPEFHGRGIPCRRGLLPSAGGEGVSDPEHPGDGPGAACRRRGPEKSLGHGGGRHPHPGLGHLAAGPGNCARCSPPRQHPDEPAHPGRGVQGGGAGPGAGGAGPGAEPPGHPHHNPGLSRGNRGVRARGPVHVLLGSVRNERRDRRAQRQPGSLRPALPPALRRQRKGRRRPSPEPEGRQPGGLCAGAGADGRGVPEAGGPHEATGICGGDHGDLSPPAG